MAQNEEENTNKTHNHINEENNTNNHHNDGTIYKVYDE